jgi:hypothetical protein
MRKDVGTMNQSQPTVARPNLVLVSRHSEGHADDTAESSLPLFDGGLGWMRGMAVVLFAYLLVALAIASAWGIWRLFR